MAFDAILERFAQRSPVTVMARIALQQALGSEWLDHLFEAHRERQYTRELLFSRLVEVMSLVAVGLRPSLHAAVKSSDVGVSTTAVYDKVNRLEPQIIRALVQGSGERLAPIVGAMGPEHALAPGYRLRVVDGNHLPASEKRIKPLRGFRGAALPGHSLVVYAPELDLVVDMVPIEDAHAQERVGMPRVIERAEEGELWLADRNFSTASIMRSLVSKGACFVIREHSVSPNPVALGNLQRVGDSSRGVVYEQLVSIRDEDGAPLFLRRIELHLNEPTEDGDTIIRLLSNAPTERLASTAAAELYLKRWTIEGLFQRLESALNSELRSLGQPRAALLAFGVAVAAYNVLAVLQKSIEAAHPEVLDDGFELSTYFIADEIRATYFGMMLALDDVEFLSCFDDLPARKVAQLLIGLAKNVNPTRFRKHKRGPKKKTKKGYVAGTIASRHVSTARVLAAGRVPPRP